MNSKPLRHRFTMLELLTVMTILAILMGMTFGLMPMITKASRDAKTAAHLKIIELALEQYNQDWGYYPQAAGEMELPVSWFESIKNKSGKTLLNSQDLNLGQSQRTGTATYVDGYSEGFYYECPGDMNPQKYDLWSSGKDRVFGGAKGADPAKSQMNDAATLNCDDITNWRQIN
jgi:prepilin-type N-terminal cleavage/methylation domain-containing protein